jgi:hypothetical protein
MHNALLQMGQEKMSKSLGNIITLDETLDRFGADAVRLFILQSHYRTPLTYSEEALEAAGAGAERLRTAAFASGPRRGDAGPPPDPEPYRQRFIAAMEDDLGTAQAIAVLYDLAREVNRARDEGRDYVPAQQLLRELSEVIGLTLKAPDSKVEEAKPFIDLLVSLRESCARRNSSPLPTVSATVSPTWASSSATAPTAQPGPRTEGVPCLSSNVFALSGSKPRRPATSASASSLTSTTPTRTGASSRMISTPS